MEKISYRMPSFFLKGTLIHFAAFKKHIGLYPPVRRRRKTEIRDRALSRREGKPQVSS